MIGLGLLGSALAARLSQSGFYVMGYDIDADKRELLKDLDGRRCESPDEVIHGCQVVFLSLPTSRVVQQLVNNCWKSLTPTSTLIDTTTGDPEEVIQTHHLLEQYQTQYVEANVAASSHQIRSGHGTLFLGGSEAVVREQEPILDAICEKRYYLGEIGSASRFKLVHNLILGLHRAVLAEGLTFAEELGFEPTTVVEILQQTPAVSGVMATKGQKMAMADYSVQARLSQHLKDVNLILNEAQRKGASTPLSELHRSILEHAEGLGYGDADNSAVIEAFRSSSSGV